MQLTFTCKHCDAELEADSSLSGTEVQCPNCSSPMTAPAAEVGPGVTLGGFQVERKIGSGGMGEVYLATQLSLDRQVALKVLRPELTRDRQVVERFIHEVRNTAKLEHPNVVTAHEAGTDSGHYYMAMSFVDGDSLASRLKREGRLPEAEALRIVAKVAEALSYAWRKHELLHRDVKPSNIMIDREGEVRLMDLGISKSFTEDAHLTMTGAVVGTPYYMSPEQARNDGLLDFRSDLYSLGATLYHLVTGKVPFSGSSIAVILSKHMRDPLPPPREGNPELTAGCALLIEAMMAKDPDERHASWPDLISDVEAVRAGRAPAVAPPASPLDLADTVASTKPPPEKTTAHVRTDERGTVAAQTDGEDADAGKLLTRAVTLGFAAGLVLLLAVVGVRLSLRSKRGAPAPAAEAVASGTEAAAELAGSAGSGRDPTVRAKPAATGAARPAAPPAKLADALAGDLLANNVAQGLKRLDEVRKDPRSAPYAEDLDKIEQFLRLVEETPQLIVSSFKKDIGYTVIVVFKTGPETLEIENVGYDRVKATRTARKAGRKERTPRSFSVDELSPMEKIKRLGHLAKLSPALAIVRGLAAAEAGRTRLAAECFQRVGGPFGNALLRQLKTRHPDLDVSEAPEDKPKRRSWKDRHKSGRGEWRPGGARDRKKKE